MMKMVIYQLKNVTLNRCLYRCAFLHQSINCHVFGSVALIVSAGNS